MKIVSDGQLSSVPSTTKITMRHLLSHTSGLPYDFGDPTVNKWRESHGENLFDKPVSVPEKYDLPLLFEPGSGWRYGCGIDWAGLTVRRLLNGISLEDYMIDNIWKKVELSAPFPTFSVSEHPEYQARVMKVAQRTPDGGLESVELSLGDNQVDQEGGAGLALSVQDYIAVLTDLISDSPKLLKLETIDMMYTPQIKGASEAFSYLIGSKEVRDQGVFEPVSDEKVNFELD